MVRQVGSISITQSDLDYYLKENHAGRSDEQSQSAALESLTERARYAQVAIDEGLDQDPAVRAEIARILSTRLKEKELFPALKETNEPIADSRLRELYEDQKQRFESPAKRRVAILWLQPGPDPDRIQRYQEKMSQARQWFFNQSDLLDQPDKGFSVLSVDYSEHAPSRFKNGDIGWLSKDGESSPWNKTVSEIAFSIQKIGEVSSVQTTPEGIFLIRLISQKPAFTKPFESVRKQIEREEQSRLRKQAEEAFKNRIKAAYPLKSDSD